MLQLALIFALAFQQPTPADAPKPKPIEAPKELIQAAEKGEVDKIRGFSQHPGFGGVDSNGRTALLAAGEKGQKAAFAALIALTNERARSTAVRLPREGQPAVGDLLTAVQARMSLFNATDKQGITPLMLAAGHGWDDLVRLLIDGGAKTTSLDTDGRSASDYADKAGHGALASTLREVPK